MWEDDGLRVEGARVEEVIAAGAGDVGDPVDPGGVAATDALVTGARAHPDRRALDDGRRAWSYRDLDVAADLLARRLMALGVRPGEVVGMLAPAGPEAVTAMYAAPRAGAALAPFHPALAARELREAIAVARPAVVLCAPAHLDAARGAAEEATRGGKPRVFVLADGALPSGDRPPGAGGQASADIHRVVPSDGPLPGSSPDDVVAILRTSGTGGTARAVALTRRNFDASARAVRARLGLGPDDVWYVSLPLAHIGGMALVDRALAAGSQVVARGPWRQEVLVKLLEADAISHVSLVPTMLGRLLDARPPLPLSLRCVLVGGAGAPPGLVERALAAGWPVALTYGMTEACSQIATAPPGLVRAKPGTAGAPLDGVEVRIAPGGEIEVRGAVVARAYHRVDPATGAEAALAGGDPAPGRTGRGRGVRHRRVAPPAVVGAAALRGADGWHRTGDLGRLDRDGHLWVTGRRAHRIVSGGVNVDPAEVARVLAAHPGVAEAAVVGLPDPEWGERVAAAIVPAAAPPAENPPREGPQQEPPQAAADIHRHCRAALGPAARPRTLKVLAALPRNPGGKVDRARLAALLSGRGETDDTDA